VGTSVNMAVELFKVPFSSWNIKIIDSFLMKSMLNVLNPCFVFM
jgi:hypothetical protein